jgi:hypothetical protein
MVSWSCGGVGGGVGVGGDDNHKNNSKYGKQQLASTQSLYQSSSSYPPKSAVEDGAVLQHQSITTSAGTAVTKSQPQQPPLYDLGMTLILNAA